jgi:hypothetical protein
MSTVKTKNVQIGDSLTATNNFTLYQPLSPDGTLRLGNGNSGSVTDAVTLTSAGNVGIGTNSPGEKLTVQGNLGVIDSSANLFSITTSALGTTTFFTNNGGGTGGTYGQYIWLSRRGSDPTLERMRIDSLGSLLVGTTNNSLGGSSHVIASGIVASGAPTSSGYSNVNSAQLEGSSGRAIINHINGTASGTLYVGFGLNGGQVGSITQSGTTAVLYNTSSDYRLKDIEGPVENSGAYIDSLKPVHCTWKADGSKFIGLIAHEAQEVSQTPVATGEKDGEQMQGMDYSNPEFIANIIAELQSLRARVTQLEGK